VKRRALDKAGSFTSLAGRTDFEAGGLRFHCMCPHASVRSFDVVPKIKPGSEGSTLSILSGLLFLVDHCCNG